MVRAIGDQPPDMWLEPCIGSGVFLDVLDELGVESNRITALDLDPELHHNDALAKTIRGLDFIDWSQKTDAKFDKIVGNPPYLALESLHSDLLKAVLSLRAPGEISVTTGANYWYAFLCASLSLLRRNGSICFVLPAAWEYADYAAPLRNSIAGFFETIEVHRSPAPMFETVSDGCIVLVGRRFGAAPIRTVRIQHGSVSSLIRHLASGYCGSRRKSMGGVLDKVPDAGNVIRFGDIAEVHLGGVTGDSNYFLLTEAQRCAHGLPRASLRPILSRARHLVAAKIGRPEWEMLLKQGERMWLFDPPPRLLSHKAVKAYLRLRPAEGGCNRHAYKVSTRNPWYRIPLEPKIDGFISGMSKHGPWLCLRGMHGLNATNTLYVVNFRKDLSREEQAAWALSMLTSRARNLTALLGRKYPEGLMKYEPSDLAEISLPIPKKIRGALSEYRQAVEALLYGDAGRSLKIADRWVLHQGK